MPFLKPEIAHFRSRFIERTEDECWEWQFGCFAAGYGSITMNGVVHYAHILSYRMFVGPVPDGLGILHTCDNRKCVNPKHLYPGTQDDNVRDMYVRGRKKVKITLTDIEDVKRRYRRYSHTRSNSRELAAEKNVDVSLIRAIVSGRFKPKYAKGSVDDVT